MKNMNRTNHTTVMNRRKAAKRRRERLIRRTAFAACFILVMVMGAVLTVKSQNKNNVEISNKAYQQMEQDYMKCVKETLKAQGLENCGVTMTTYYQEDGSRSYDLLIHHKLIDKMTQQQRMCLTDSLENISFPIENCRFEYSFLLS